MKVADHYPSYRGGKYGCGVFCVVLDDLQSAMDGDCTGDLIAYFPSIHGEPKPFYNHRCDIFNTLVTSIISHEEYETNCPQWINNLINEREQQADKLNAIQLNKTTA